MPKVILDRKAEKERIAGCVIAGLMAYHRKEGKDVAKGLKKSPATISRRLRNPYDLTLGEFSDLVGMLKMSNEDILKITRGVEKV